METPWERSLFFSFRFLQDFKDFNFELSLWPKAASALPGDIWKRNMYNLLQCALECLGWWLITLMVFKKRLRFKNAFRPPELRRKAGVFKFLLTLERFRDSLVWTAGLTVKISAALLNFFGGMRTKRLTLCLVLCGLSSVDSLVKEVSTKSRKLQKYTCDTSCGTLLWDGFGRWVHGQWKPYIKGKVYIWQKRILLSKGTAKTFWRRVV